MRIAWFTQQNLWGLYHNYNVGHLQPRCHAEARSLSRQLWNGLFSTTLGERTNDDTSYPFSFVSTLLVDSIQMITLFSI